MPRPKKCRRICSIPENLGFKPIGKSCDDKNTITITLDEYESIRLIDFEKLSQEQCANQMNVARTTITSMYESARYKIADGLINGKAIFIEGGNVELCEHNNKCCGKGCIKKCFENENVACGNSCSHK